MLNLRSAVQRCVRRASIVGSCPLRHHTSRNNSNVIYVSRQTFADANVELVENASQHSGMKHLSKMPEINSKSSQDIVNDQEANRLSSITDTKSSSGIANDPEVDSAQSIADIEPSLATANDPEGNEIPLFSENSNSQDVVNSSGSAKDVTGVQMPALNDNKSAQDTTTDPETGGIVSVSDNKTSQDNASDPKVEASQSIVDNSGLNPAQDSKNLESNGNSEVAENVSISGAKGLTEIEMSAISGNKSAVDMIFDQHIGNDPEANEIPSISGNSDPQDMVNSLDTEASQSIPDIKELNLTQNPVMENSITVEGFSKEVTEDSLKEFYSQYGQVVGCTINTDPDTGKQSATVEFSSKETVDSMNSSHRETHRVNQAKVPVRIGSEADATPSIDQNPKNLLFRRYHILVKGFSGRMTEDALQKFYSNFGDIIRCQIRNVGVGAKEAHAHVVFSSKEAMNHALKTLPHIINDEKVSAKVGTNKDELTLRLLNLSPETTEKSLKKFYSRFGSLNQCEVKKDSETGESTMGYVSFASQHELDRALDAQPHFIDGSEVFLKYLTGELDLRSKNVPEGITEESLRTYFSRYGQLRHCELFKTAKGINIAHLSFSSVNEVNEAFENGPHKIEGALVRVQRPTSKKDRLKKALLFESDELIDMVGEPEANKNRSIPESRKVNMELNPTQARLQKHLESDGYSKVAENTSISAPEVRHTQVNKSSTQTRLQIHLESDEKSKVALNTSISAPEVCLSENTISITIPIGFIKSLPDMVNDQDANRTISITGTMPTQSKALNITQSSKNAIQSSKNLEFRRYHIVVRGFSENVTVDMLREFYSRFGEVIRCEIKKHRNGEMSAVVVFSSKKAMNRAWMTVSNHINKEKVFVTGAPDSHELTLRLLNLSPETTEESLRKFYSRFGKVKYCEVNKNSRSGETLPSYVSFASHEDLDRALDAQPHFIDGSEVFLKYATGDLDLEIKNVPEGITEESLRTFFSKYGQLRQCELPKISNGLYTGFVSFSAINEVNRAMEDRPHVIDRKILKTDFVGKSGLFPIFVGRIPKNATLMSLVKTFSKFGKIVHLEMRNDGHGFVSYGTKEEADKALNTPQHMVEGAVVNVQIVAKKTDKFKKQ